MNWKDFFKPNLVKVLVIIFLIIISFTFGVRSESSSPEQITQIDLPYTKTYFNPVLWLSYGLGTTCPGSEPFCFIEWTSNVNITTVILNTPVQFVGTLVYWYLISCLILFLYSKFKKK